MKINVLGSTKMGYEVKKEEALDFGAKAAGVCYMPDNFEAILSEPVENTEKRVNQTLKSGHHSVYDHATVNLLLENIPKILAMVLNNEGMYTTSEKSARYTKMQPSEKELELYNKWYEIFKELIDKKYREKYIKFGMSEKKVDIQFGKLAQENARYTISVFTPTTMVYTVSFRQLNYIISFFKKFISSGEETQFNLKLKDSMKDFIDSIPENLKVELLNADVKERNISMFDTRKNRKESFSETYCTTYKGSFAEYAQAHRHRTIRYNMSLLSENEYYIPEIIKDDEKLVKEWILDISSVSDIFPQGMLINIVERGTYEDFILKCKERLCGCAQLEIALQTKKTLSKYLLATEKEDKDIYDFLKNYEKGARCTFPGYNCESRCVWGAVEALTRKI